MKEERADEPIHGIEFEGEERVAEIAEDWHLKNLEKADVGDVVGPAGHGPIIPEFPEEAEKQTRDDEGEGNDELAVFEMTDDAWLLVEVVNGIEQEEEAQPDEREGECGKKEGCNEAEYAEDHEGMQQALGNPMLSLQMGMAKEVDGAEELNGLKQGGQDGRERERGHEVRFYHSLRAFIAPVLHTEIDELEYPPEEHRDEDHAQELLRMRTQQRAPPEIVDHRIDREDIAEPDYREIPVGKGLYFENEVELDQNDECDADETIEAEHALHKRLIHLNFSCKGIYSVFF